MFVTEGCRNLTASPNYSEWPQSKIGRDGAVKPIPMPNVWPFSTPENAGFSLSTESYPKTLLPGVSAIALPEPGHKLVNTVTVQGEPFIRECMSLNGCLSLVSSSATTEGWFTKAYFKAYKCKTICVVQQPKRWMECSATRFAPYKPSESFDL